MSESQEPRAPVETSADLEQARLFGPFRLVPARQLLLQDGAPVALGARALELLVVLTGKAGEVVGKQELVSRVWRGLFVEESNLRVHVAALRRALRDGEDGNRYIVNVPGRGYSFVAPVTAAGEVAEPPRPEAVQDRIAALPRSATRVIGRDAVIDALCAQLAQRRFVTLVGPGGIGKTTVAVAVAHRLAAAYPAGVCFVDFSPLRDPELVPASIAAAFGLAVPSRDVMPTIVAHLARRSVLLVLDNCEHVVETAAGAAEQISTNAPDVHVLATSREPLRAAGEKVQRLPPLESPTASAGLTAAEALTFPCVQLFQERVAARLGEFRLSDADAPFVAEICQKLDGIALAVELAAGRVAAFGVRELAAHLDDRFHLLTSGRRTALPRQQTLSATLDWSYGLLPEAEQTLLRRLSIFAGDFSLEAARALMADADASQVISQIADLVAKSLVVADWSDGGVRYRLLNTTRLYGAGKLREADEQEAVRRSHARHYLALFETAEHELETLPTQAWRRKYESKIDNLRDALDWADSPEGEPEIYVALAASAVPLWVQLSLMGECRTRVERALALLTGVDRGAKMARMRLLAARGWALMFATGRASEIGTTWAAALELAEELDDPGYQLRALWGVWIGKLNHGDLDAALGIATRLLELVRPLDHADAMTADRLMATTLHYRGDQDGARVYIERVFARYSPGAARPKIARFQVDQQVTAGYFQARILWLQGHPDQALQAVRRNIRDGEALGHALSFASVLGQAACPILLLTGDLAGARRHATMLLEHAEAHALHLWHDWAGCFLALVAVREGEVETGLAAMQATFDRAGDSRFLPRYMLLLAQYAEEAGHAGQHRLALETVEAMLARCAQTGERWYEPELMRLRGEALRADGDRRDEAARCFADAMALAAGQGARSWRLRAAISLARLLRDRGEARLGWEQLSEVHTGFTEGFATRDLRVAACLLDALRPVADGGRRVL